MQKVYKKLTKDQIKRNVIFSSCLSVCKTEQEKDTIHEVFQIGKDGVKVDFDKNQEEISRLKDDKFFNSSHWKFNIIRQ
ncbi:MAG TPA: hypothetical protein VMZ91_09680 [Candidatus Paceibacterota bacterium]|nr:hypothetical protein [Candidatus Paceibacterota bacterium]